MDDNFILVTVDLTMELTDDTVEKYIENNGMSVDESDNLADRDFDIFFSNNKWHHREVKNAYKTLEKFNNKKVLKLRESLNRIDLDLCQTIDILLRNDSSLDSVIFNELKHDELIQLVNLTAAQSYLKPIIKQEVTICMDEACFDDYKHYLVAYLVDMYIFNTPVPNMHIVPTYGAFAKAIRHFKCFYQKNIY